MAPNAGLARPRVARSPALPSSPPLLSADRARAEVQGRVSSPPARTLCREAGDAQRLRRALLNKKPSQRLSFIASPVSSHLPLSLSFLCRGRHTLTNTLTLTLPWRPRWRTADPPQEETSARLQPRPPLPPAPRRAAPRPWPATRVESTASTQRAKDSQATQGTQGMASAAPSRASAACPCAPRLQPRATRTAPRASRISRRSRSRREGRPAR